jgi:hypothetical protein
LTNLISYGIVSYSEKTEKEYIMLLREAIAAVIPQMVEEWNEIQLPLLEQAAMGTPFSVIFKDRLTQEKTKWVSPYLDISFAYFIKKYIPDFEVTETVGRDYTWNGVGFECKITFGKDGWTGNGYAKTSKHILLRFTLTKDGKISEMFAALVELDKCKSRWTDPTTKSNFSTLKFVKEDADLLDIIVGDMKINKVYIKPIMCAV